jgi:uncharacterized protein (DUF362 family)
VAKISGAIALFSIGMGGNTVLAGDSKYSPQDKDRFLIEGFSSKHPYDIKELTRKIFDAAGGINKFISRGDVVVIKPNISWARRPDLGATTNPEVLEAVIILCQEAGAKKVRIVDNTINEPVRCFAITGAGNVAERTGAELVFPRSSMMKETKIHGHVLDVWPVFLPFLEADKVINLPVAKVHGLSHLTLGMKGWIGAVGGRRGALHQDIHQVIVDLAQFFRPTLILIDAIRILVRNGPSGGSLSDVLTRDTLLLSNDQVAADSKGATLFGINPDQVGHIALAKKWRLGTDDLKELLYKRITL